MSFKQYSSLGAFLAGASPAPLPQPDPVELCRMDDDGGAMIATGAGRPSREGYRIAFNRFYRPGYYVRPDDELSFSPAEVFNSEGAAWAAWEREGI